GNSAPLLTFPSSAMAGFTAATSSFVFDYCARQKIGYIHMNFFVVEQLPVLPPSVFLDETSWSRGQSIDAWMLPRVLELTCTAVDMAGFGSELGYDGPPFVWNAERRRQLRSELDAACFYLYGLNREEVGYVMDTFPIVRRKDEVAFGEYRTKR